MVLILALAVWALPISATVHAQADKPRLADVLEDKEEADAESLPENLGPQDEFGRGNPRSSLRGYINAAGSGDFERAAEYLDLRNLPAGMDAAQGPEYARQLKIVLERGLWFDLDDVSTDPRGRPNAQDGLPSYRDLVGRIEVKGRDVNILLQRVPRGDGAYIWKFSNATVRELPALYEQFGYGPIGEKLSRALPQLTVLGLDLWQWIIVVFLLAAGYAVALAVTWPLAYFLKRSDNAFYQQLASITAGPLRLLIVILVARSNFEMIRPSVEARAVAEGQTLLIITLTWLVLRIVELIRRRMGAAMLERGAAQGEVLLRPAATAVKIVIVLIALIIWLENLGFKATTLLAGLGIGGLAVALAAQKSVENLIGAITLYTATPVKLGDFCKVGETMGVVEEIGLRYSKIRTLDRTQVTLPNSVLADARIENFAGRDKVWFHPKIRLRIDTTSDQIRVILIDVREMLIGHPKIETDSARIRFVGIGEESLDLEVFAYILTTDYVEYLEINEDLTLRILDIVTAAGTMLAIPLQQLTLERRREQDAGAAERATERVRALREEGELHLPTLPEEKVEAIRDTLTYPPSPSSG